MKKTYYIINQAVAKEYKGIKGIEFGGKATGVSNTGLFFSNEESAYDYLRNVILQVKREIKLGIRPQNNLNKEESLDFCVTSVEFDIPEEKMIGRGWKLND